MDDKENLATVPDTFWKLVDAEYWSICHEDPEESDDANLYAAYVYVDAETGICGCCGVDYRNVKTRPDLAAQAEKYPNNVVLRMLSQR